MTGLRHALDREDDRGFTLIELLVVVVIIGILIAIAIPLYLNYEKGAKDKSAQSDLRNAMPVLEQCNADNNVFPSALGTASGNSYPALTGCSAGKINFTSGTTVTYYPNAATTAYIVSTTNSGGSGKIYCYSSVNGGSVTTTTTALTAYRTTC